MPQSFYLLIWQYITSVIKTEYFNYITMNKPIKNVKASNSPGIKWPEREPNYSPVLNTELKMRRALPLVPVKQGG
jgi:hypothetical protein